MIYWFTGQPGHGKTLNAIAKALEFKKAGRVVYACNINQLDHAKTGFVPMTPDEFRNWMTVLPDGAVCLVDEAYQFNMLPKRPPSSAVPAHVEKLATHRHRGLDFIFVSQSPDKQIDSFVVDLIEEQTHVRRRFGTSYQHLRIFDRYEKDPEKRTPLRIKRQMLPKHVFGLYKSTELDTTERKIPWYFFGFAIGIPLALGLMYYTFGNMGERLGGGAHAAEPGATRPGANGATAPVAHEPRKPLTNMEYVAQYVPRIATQPWSAPAYDGIKPPSEAPRAFCMASGAGEDSEGNHREESCSCITEQGTRYNMAMNYCMGIARNGQYEPLYSERNAQDRDGLGLGERSRQEVAAAQALQMGADQAPSYGEFRDMKPSGEIGGAR